MGLREGLEALFSVSISGKTVWNYPNGPKFWGGNKKQPQLKKKKNLVLVPEGTFSIILSIVEIKFHFLTDISKYCPDFSNTDFRNQRFASHLPFPPAPSQRRIAFVRTDHEAREP